MDLNEESSSPATPLLGSQRYQHQQQHQQQADVRPSRNTDIVAPLATESAAVSQHHGDDDDDNRQARELSFYTRRITSAFATIVVDERGTGWPVVIGLMILIGIGTILGTVLPGDSELPAKDGYRFLSNAIGYTYFMSWSVSFYPQVISNFRRKSTLGLSPDFCGLNVVGFGCYTIYNIGLFFVPAIQAEYKERHGADATISVQSNDVAFAVHAFCLASFTLGQIGYYNGFRGSSSPSKVILGVAALFLAAILLGPLVVVAVDKLEWLDYLYLLGNIKVMITLMKYIPQVILNVRRKSTTGWSIWNIILDFTGGTLSDVQLVLDCAALGDWSGITGNMTKLALGSVSVVFDCIFMVQHYILYPSSSGRANSSTQGGRQASLDEDADNSSTRSDMMVETEPLAAIDDQTL